MIMRSLILLMAMISVLGTTSTSLAVSMYSMEVISSSYGNYSYGRLNDSGQVVGSFYPSGDGVHAFYWEKGNITDLGTGYLRDINNSGQAAGVLINGTTHQGVLWENGNITYLDGSWSSPYSINNSGQIVGSSNIDGFGAATIWENGIAKEILPESYDGDNHDSAAVDINDSGRIAIVNNYGSFLNTILWENDSLIAEYPVISPMAINNNGAVVGSYDDSVIPLVIREDGVITEFTTVPWSDPWADPYQYWGIAAAINDLGQIVGAAENRAVLWENNVPYDLKDLIIGSDGWRFVNAVDINEKGQIIVTGILNGDTRVRMVALLTPVPEPSTMLLLGLGLVGLAGVRRKFQK